MATHSGSFHPDDVLSVAALKKIDPKLKIVRTRDKGIIKEAEYVVDVGGEYDPKRKRFDHHQVGGAGERDDRVPYASFGLVWREYGAHYCGSKTVADYIEKNLVEYIDAMDNGEGEIKPISGDIYPYTFGNFIMDMNPVGNVGAFHYNRAFEKAVAVASLALDNFVLGAKYFLEAESKILDSYQKSDDKRIVIFDEKYPWQDVLKKIKEPIYVVEPGSMRGEWKVTCVRDNPRDFTNRKDLPKEWAGKRDTELVQITGVKDAVFCHNKLFTAYAKSKEGAIKLAELAFK